MNDTLRNGQMREHHIIGVKKKMEEEKCTTNVAREQCK